MSYVGLISTSLGFDSRIRELEDRWNHLSEKVLWASEEASRLGDCIARAEEDFSECRNNMDSINVMIQSTPDQNKQSGLAGLLNQLYAKAQSMLAYANNKKIQKNHFTELEGRIQSEISRNKSERELLMALSQEAKRMAPQALQRWTS